MRILLERAGKGSISNSRFHLMQPCSPSTQLFGPDPSATPRASIQLATCAGHGFSFFFAWRPTARRSCRAWRVGRPTARRSCRAWQGDLRGRRQQRAPRWVLQRGHPAIGVGQEERAGCEKEVHGFGTRHCRRIPKAPLGSPLPVRTRRTHDRPAWSEEPFL